METYSYDKEREQQKMIIHSFFLDLTKIDDLTLPFLEEKSFCLKDNYDGIHPVLKDFGGPHQIHRKPIFLPQTVPGIYFKSKHQKE